MSRSIVLEVRQAVIDGIAELLNDQQVSVTYGWQGASDDARREQVFTNNAHAVHSSASMRPGRNFRDEQMNFEIVISVIGPGLRPEETDARALEIGQVVEEFIADHKSNELGINGLNWIVITEFALENRVAASSDGAGSLSQITYTVHYQARLT